MPFLKLNFRPGVNRDTTSYAGEGGFYECDKIRFFSGFPQKIGGWVKPTPAAFLGVCRQMWNWITSFSDNFLAVGTNKKVYIEVGGVFYDITPIRDTTAAGDVTFAATSGSSVITVSDTGFGSSAGDFVTFSGAVSLGGNITAAVLNQNYEIATVVNSSTYTIIAKNPSTGAAVLANASDSGDGGASVVGEYEIPTGPALNILGYGWGAGAWSGNYGWGLSGDTPFTTQQQDWWFDNFDNDLVMNIRNGAIYYWERGSLTIPTTALAVRATLLSSLTGANSVPAEAMQVLVSQNDKHLLALGCTPYYTTGPVPDADPLLIRWASQDEPQVWNPSGANSAGFIRVSRGSKIVRGLATRQEILIWTNSNLYSLQYTGTTEVFALQELADNISIIAPRAVASANNITYWMGQDKFYVYTGQVQTLPCTLREYVYSDINFSQADQIIAGTNEGFTEIWWFYPSANSNWNDRYVIFNHLENCWYYGNIVRTAWLDTALRGNPLAASTEQDADSGYLYEHEVGVDDDGAPMTAYIESNDFDLGDGEQFMLTRRLIPDFSFNRSTASSPELTMTIKTKRFSGSPYASDAADTQSVVEVPINASYTGQVFLRARGRQVAFRVESDDLGVQWQLGSVRLDVRPDGRR
jgi:hypothetical protein